MRLYHISDEAAIEVFQPRPSENPAIPGNVVWAMDAEHLPNYLFPRDCPRVTFRACENTSVEDIDRLLGGTSARVVIAVETAWLRTIRDTRLYVYEFLPEGFALADEIAGYYVSRAPVVPVCEREVGDLLSKITSHDVELRVMPSLWKLREAVIHSTLAYSIIRMRNAQPPAEGCEAYHPLPGRGPAIDKSTS